jgi:hypothetical protein
VKVPRPPIRTALHKSSSQSGAQNYHLHAKLLLRCSIYFGIAILRRGFADATAAGCKTVGAAWTSRIACLSGEEGGAWGRIRTTDTRIFNPLLYQLSYPGEGRRRGEPRL